MDVHPVFLYGLNRSTFSLPSKILPSSQDQYRAVSHGIDACNGRNLSTTIAERRSAVHPTPLTLSRKRSIRSIASEHALDVQALRSSSSPRVCSRKRTKETTLTLPNPKRSDSNGAAADLPSSLQESARNEENNSIVGVYSVTIDNQDEAASPKTLRSPIEFNQPLYSSDTVSARTDLNKALRPKSLTSSQQSRYQYYAPTNPADQADRFHRHFGRIPRCQLSYGDPKPWSLHHTKGLHKLRLEAGLEAEDKESFLWSNDIKVVADAISVKPWNSEPTRSKPGLWLDLVDDGEQIEEAVRRTLSQ